MKIFVAGLPYDLDDAELTEIFEKFGTIASAKVAIDRNTGRSKGFAFVDMPNDDEAKDAIENLNDISLGKKPMIVKKAEDRPSSSRTYGSDSFRSSKFDNNYRTRNNGGFARRDDNRRFQNRSGFSGNGNNGNGYPDRRNDSFKRNKGGGYNSSGREE